MKNKKRYEILWEKFLSIINDKTLNDSYTNNLDIEIRKIKTIIEKEPNEIKKVLIIESLISFINSKISRNTHSSEIINSMYTHVLDTKKRLKDKDYYFEKGTSTKVEQLYKALYEAKREELILLENQYNTILKEKTEALGQKRARGEIIGSLNKGMYDSTREELSKAVKDNGIVLKNDDRFISYMNNDLLKFRIIALRLSGVYIDKALEKHFEKTKDASSLMSKNEYNKLREKIENLGNYIKIIYENNFNLFPRDEILINIFGIDSEFMKKYFSNEKHK